MAQFAFAEQPMAMIGSNVPDAPRQGRLGIGNLGVEAENEIGLQRLQVLGSSGEPMDLIKRNGAGQRMMRVFAKDNAVYGCLFDWSDNREWTAANRLLSEVSVV